ncbi:hypothetical protein RND81_09G257900 [Saponaria officinalis]|uniref:Neprosin PEP catalytic domain-containing protein n=1 Tax=Saponaria officinalis TaxID=3572 RepID=A0AAW1IS99_SAPOF
MVLTKVFIVIFRTTGYGKFYGSQARASLHKPKVQGRQWSSARIKLSRGDESIEGGWMVNPALFGNDEAHLYVRYSVGTSGCINTKCPGFIQASNGIRLGSRPQSYSQIGGRQFVWRFSIFKHKSDGNWWFSMSWETQWHHVGFWPSSLFTSLNDFADQVQWGGEISDPNLVEPAPVMGSGARVDEYNPQVNAYFEHIIVVDEDRNFIQPKDTVKFYDCPNIYRVDDAGDRGGDIGRVFCYGGSYQERH